jgi:hypothetical protein
MSVFTMANAKFYIGTTAAADDLTSYEGDTYAEVGESQTISDLIDTQNFTGFSALKDARVRQLKTTKEGQNITLTCGYDPEDAGQVAMRAAAAVTQQTNYNFKLEYNDDDANPTTVYWSGVVGNDPYPGGANEDVATVEFMITNNTGFVVEIRS